jgi:UDP-3-O-[3-hydroxymyristoyl] glucosamine N-acyltransferase
MRDFVIADCELTTGVVAELTGAKLREGDPVDRPIRNIAPLDIAGAFDISFLDNSKYAGELATTRAAACLIAPRFVERAPRSLVVLETVQPYPAFIAVTRKLFANLLRPTSMFGVTGRAASAQIDPTAHLEAGVAVDPLAVIGPRAAIGAGTLIGAGAVIGPDVCIGRNCAVGVHASILHAIIGDRVIIHPGVRIGQDGFGFLPSPQGHKKIPQTRRVIIQDDVEIGANTTIDRGATRDTIIGEGTKIDNLVQIGHNVSIGRHCLIVSQVGISGSVTIGDFAVLAGQVGVADHLTIGEGAVLGAKAGVMSNVPAGARWGGFPAEPAIDWKRGQATVRRLVRRGKAERKDRDAEGPAGADTLTQQHTG